LSATPYEVLAEDLASELIFLAGQLGRLVEQYSWRFQHEKAVEIGEGARKGASAGGRAKARLSEIKRSSWQDEALNIWANRPDLSKRAVADGNLGKGASVLQSTSCGTSSVERLKSSASAPHMRAG
jgi:hypothetical protein